MTSAKVSLIALTPSVDGGDIRPRVKVSWSVKDEPLREAAQPKVTNPTHDGWRRHETSVRRGRSTGTQANRHRYRWGRGRCQRRRLEENLNANTNLFSSVDNFSVRPVRFNQSVHSLCCAPSPSPTSTISSTSPPPRTPRRCPPRCQSLVNRGVFQKYFRELFD